jgi:hypothetical protein
VLVRAPGTSHPAPHPSQVPHRGRRPPAAAPSHRQPLRSHADQHAAAWWRAGGRRRGGIRGGGCGGGCGGDRWRPGADAVCAADSAGPPAPPAEVAVPVRRAPGGMWSHTESPGSCGQLGAASRVWAPAGSAAVPLGHTPRPTAIPLPSRPRRHQLEPLLPPIAGVARSCHPALSAIPNRCVYGGRLRDGVTAAQRGPLLPGLPPLAFVDVAGGVAQRGQGGSSSNRWAPPLHGEGEVGGCSVCAPSTLGLCGCCTCFSCQ